MNNVESTEKASTLTIRETPELRVKIGLVVWLKNLAREYGLNVRINPYTISLYQEGVDDRPLLIAGVTKKSVSYREVETEGVDFVTLLIDPFWLNDTALAGHLSRELAVAGAHGIDEDIDGSRLLFVVNVLKEETAIATGQPFEDEWDYAIAGLVGGSSNRMQGQLARPDGEVLGMVARMDNAIKIMMPASATSATDLAAYLSRGKGCPSELVDERFVPYLHNHLDLISLVQQSLAVI